MADSKPIEPKPVPVPDVADFDKAIQAYVDRMAALHYPDLTV